MKKILFLFTIVILILPGCASEPPLLINTDCDASQMKATKVSLEEALNNAEQMMALIDSNRYYDSIDSGESEAAEYRSYSSGSVKFIGGFVINPFYLQNNEETH